MPETSRRRYASARREEAAEATRGRILDAAGALFAEHGIDRVRIADIAVRAGVGASTVYAAFSSKAGVLHALMTASLFGPRFRKAQDILAGADDPVVLVAMTAQVARAIYESETEDLGLLRGASSFSPELRAMEAEFEAVRYEMQAERVERLFAAGRQRTGLDLAQARRVMWMYTSRDVYRMLVQDGGWSPDQYQDWLSRTLTEALVRPDAAP